MPTIFELYTAGVSARALADRYNVHNSTILRNLKKVGATIRSLSESMRTYTADYHYFDTIDSAEKAHILGFLYADGCVLVTRDGKDKRLQISLSVVDYDYLLQIRSAIHSDHNIYYRSIKNKHCAVQFKINSVLLCDGLIKHGCHPRKSLKLCAPPIDDKFLRDFICGFLYGDGSISLESFKYTLYPTIDFASNESFLLWIKSLLKKYLTIEGRVYKEKRSNCYHLVYSGIQARDLCEWLFVPEPALIMQRKYDRAMLAIQYQVRQTQGAEGGD